MHLTHFEMKSNWGYGIIIHGQKMSYIANNSSLYNYNKLNSTLNYLKYNCKFNKFVHKIYKNDNQQHQHKRAYFLKIKIWKKLSSWVTKLWKRIWHKHLTKAIKNTLLKTASIKCFWWMVNVNNGEFCPNLQMNSCLFLNNLSTSLHSCIGTH